ncbi:MAG: bifunctional folylpolyglutamate synthase/dihydrofolate synthase [Erysipelotrichaceae bacterium]|nr:bifunctional folylpolyglutamate synthase/dihydrofolate synthase [Erysipelotrichaceae bacterium]
MFTTVQESLDWVMNRRKGEMQFADFQRVMKKLGDPQDQLKVIHVTGTNGKGSTVAYLRDLLVCQGYKVGTLQSPHYITHLDRIRINGENIPGEVFLRLVNQYYDFFTEEGLGMFEIDYILMVSWFLEEKVDFAITEVGIGGRLDSTNVIHHPILSLITNVGYDHMEKLGDTLEKICFEKCGIIKENSAVLAGDLSEDLKRIVKDTAIERHASYHELSDWHKEGDQSFSYKGETYEISSLADYQLKNAVMALEAFFLTAQIEGIGYDPEKVKEALKKTSWPGRFELLCKQPLIVMDGAHNTHGMKALIASVDALKGRKLVIFSALKRKEYGKMLQMWEGHCDKLVLTSFPYPGKSGSIGREEAQGYEYTEDYISYIQEHVKDYDVILLCGSLYFISDIAEKKEVFKDMEQ